MSDKYAIADMKNRMYVLCWTENDTVFLTPDPAKARVWNNIDDVKRAAKDYSEDARRFLSDVDEKELRDVDLQAFKMNVKYTFAKV